MEQCTLAVYQGLSNRGDVQKNIQVIKETVEKIKADVIVFPELFLCGYDIGHENLRKFSEPKDGPSMKIISNISKENQIAIAIPYAEREGENVYNSMALFDSKGDLVLNYRKCQLWSSYEATIFTPGTEEDLKVVLLDNKFKVGMLICFDLEFPEISRVLTLKGAEVLLISTALADSPTNDIIPKAFVNTRAQENQVFVVYSNFPYESNSIPAKDTIETPRIEYCGQSAIVGPDGADIVRMSKDQIDVAVAHVEMKTYKDHFLRNPYLASRRPELYKAITNLST